MIRFWESSVHESALAFTLNAGSYKRGERHRLRVEGVPPVLMKRGDCHRVSKRQEAARLAPF